MPRQRALAAQNPLADRIREIAGAGGVAVFPDSDDLEGAAIDVTMIRGRPGKPWSPIALAARMEHSGR